MQTPKSKQYELFALVCAVFVLGLGASVGSVITLICLATAGVGGAVAAFTCLLLLTIAALAASLCIKWRLDKQP